MNVGISNAPTAALYLMDEKDARKVIKKTQDCLRPNMKNKDGLPITDEEFNTITEEITELSLEGWISQGIVKESNERKYRKMLKGYSNSRNLPLHLENIIELMSKIETLRGVIANRELTKDQVDLYKINTLTDRIADFRQLTNLERQGMKAILEKTVIRYETESKNVVEKRIDEFCKIFYETTIFSPEERSNLYRDYLSENSIEIGDDSKGEKKINSMKSVVTYLSTHCEIESCDFTGFKTQVDDVFTLAQYLKSHSHIKIIALHPGISEIAKEVLNDAVDKRAKTPFPLVVVYLEKAENLRQDARKIAEANRLKAEGDRIGLES